MLKKITKLLKKNGIKINPSSTQVKEYKALPDTLDEFKAYFIDDKNEVKNMGLFKRRIIGLASYFRSAQESLMPKYNKSEDFHVVEIPMSDFQFGVYEEARVQERKLEMQNAKKRKKQAASGVFEETVSTYRIFSRAFCNYVFPAPDIRRPMPAESLESAIGQAVDEDIFDIVSKDDKINNVDGRYDADEVAAVEADLDDGLEARLVDGQLVRVPRVDLRLREVDDRHEHARAHLRDHRHRRPADVPGAHAADLRVVLGHPP